MLLPLNLVIAHSYYFISELNFSPKKKAFPLNRNKKTSLNCWQIKCLHLYESKCLIEIKALSYFFQNVIDDAKLKKKKKDKNNE